MAPARLTRHVLVNGALLVAGATSDAGKSLVTAGICRWLHRQGVSVAPFKAQNMSNNSVVTPGGEIGRAQALQAAACGLDPEPAMNPVLIKPGSDRESHLVVRGQPYGKAGAMSYGEQRPVLRQAALDGFDELRSRFDVVICEGAGSPTEINLRATDIVNMGFATERDVPTIVVGDIDRGGVFPSLFGTVALLSARDQSLIAGFVVNKFRGDVRLLEPGLRMLHDLTSRPTFGVLPWRAGLALDVEDGLGLADGPLDVGPPHGRDVLRIAAIRLPRLSNSTDLDALASEPGVLVRWTVSPSEVLDADLVVVPGTRATVDDLAWLRSTGLAGALARRALAGRPVLGICGGYQMLARTIVDRVESGAGTVAGLGLLPVDVRFEAAKVLARPVGSALGEPVTTAYEIHHGVVARDEGAEPFLDGCRQGAVWGTTWHGTLESDGFRRAFLGVVAQAAGRDFVPAPDTRFADLRTAHLDALGDLVADHLDTTALETLISGGAPAGLPFIPPGAPA